MQAFSNVPKYNSTTFQKMQAFFFDFFKKLSTNLFALFSTLCFAQLRE